MIENLGHCCKCFLLLLVVTSGCASFQSKPKSDPAPPQFFVHTLSAGETLGQLSTWYTGQEAHWKEFFIRASDGDRHKLRVGGIVLIPGTLLLRTDPPTTEFLSKPKKKVVKATSAKTENAPEGTPTNTSEGSAEYNTQSNLENNSESLVHAPLEEPIVVEQKDIQVEEKSQNESLENEFLGQIIDSTKLRSKERDNSQPTPTTP